MEFHILTIFPNFFRGPFEHGVVQRAQDRGLVQTFVHDLRGFTHDRHRTVDDRPFGGGEGMVLKPEPIFAAVRFIRARNPIEHSRVVLLTPQGKRFEQVDAFRFAELSQLILICGRYEGVDERVAEHLADECLSIGDYVLSGGELAAAVLVDAITRLIPGAVGKQGSIETDSFSFGARSGSPQKMLGWPQYTRPENFEGLKVPEVLLSGDHEKIAAWRRAQAFEKTKKYRSELLDSDQKAELEEIISSH